MQHTDNIVTWFEIPASDLVRATHFYETIFGITLYNMDMPEADMKMAVFPMDLGNGRVSGCLAQSPFHTPAAVGAVVYLNANPDMNAVLGRVMAAGGSVVMPKTRINDSVGFMSSIMDTEGNRVALHSQN